MFNLDEAISKWRGELSRAGMKTPAVLDELENHLREDIERQMGEGVSAEAALASAAARIGRAAALKQEFAKTSKVNRPQDLARRIFLIAFAGSFFPSSTYALTKFEMSFAWRLLGLAANAVVVLVMLGGEFKLFSLPCVPDKRTRTAIGISCTVVGIAGAGVFMNFVLPRLELTMGQLTVVALWTLTFMTALGGVWSGLDAAANKRTDTVDS
jgi:hypothetical protein